MAESASLGQSTRILLRGGSRSFRPSPFELVVLLALLFVAAYVGYAAYARATDLNAPAAAPSTYFPAFRSTLTSTVNATGTVSATQQVTLTFGSAGKIKEFFAKLGDQVKAGQPLAKLDDAELQQALRFSEANLASQEARLAAATEGPSATDSASAAQTVASAGAQLTTAKNNLADTLAKPTAADLATAAQGVLTAQNAVQTAEDAKTKAANDVKKAETDLATAKTNIETAQEDRDDAVSARSKALSTLDYQRAQLTGALNKCNPSPSIDVPDTPDDGSTAATVQSLPYNFRCRTDATPTPVPSATPGTGSGSGSSNSNQSAVSSQLSAYNSAASAYNSAVATVKTKEAAVTTAQNAVTTANTTLTTAINTQTSGSLDRAISNAQIGLASAQQKETETKAGAKSSEIESARRAVESAEASVLSAEAKQEELSEPPAPDVILPLQASVEEARSNVEEAKKNLDAATIMAPFDGQISQVTGDVGTSVTATTAVFILLNPRLIRIDANVDQADISNLKANQTANVTFDALAGRSYQATVTAIGLTPTIQQGVVTYVVTLGIDTSVLSADTPVPTPGMTASIQVTTSRTENALVVPSRAIRRVGRAQQVTVKTAAGGEEVRTVTTGATNGTLVQVLSGVSDGEEVLVSASTTASSSTTTTTGTNPLGGGGTTGGNPFQAPAPGR